MGLSSVDLNGLRGEGVESTEGNYVAMPPRPHIRQERNYYAEGVGALSYTVTEEDINDSATPTIVVSCRHVRRLVLHT